MNQTIKKRIEEINSGIVPEGYEKTSFGIFPCDWEKDKSLGDICEINPKTEALPNEFIYIDLESVVDGKLIQENVIENAKAPSRAQRVLQKNDIIYQMVRPYQKNNFIFIQDDGSFKYVASTGYAQLRSDNYVFLYQMVNSEYFCTQVLKKCTGTNYPAINSQDLAEVNCAYPKDEQEQSRIAEILMQWDKAIELQEKLIEAYQKSKKYYLNKMFPKKGSYVPEIRFPGFTAPWEQRKLGDIGKTYRGLSGKSKEDFGHGDARFVTYMNVFSNPVGDPAMTEAIELDSRQNEVKKGDIFFTTSSETPEEVGMSCVWMENTPNTYLNSFCFGYRPIVELDLYYLAYVLRSNTVRHKFIFLAQGISRYNISKNKVMEMLIPVPNKGEQVLLGAFFKNLDNLITLHQQKRDKLLKQRKAMQQYLLTGIVRV